MIICPLAKATGGNVMRANIVCRFYYKVSFQDRDIRKEAKFSIFYDCWHEKKNACILIVDQETAKIRIDIR
jgi:hypothetical protein